METHTIDWSQCEDAESVPDRLSGTWVLKGTRVPAEAIIDNAEDGYTAEQIATEIFDNLPIERVRGVLRFAERIIAAEEMKILLDHNTPLGVRRILVNHDVHPAGRMGWAKLSNTDLLDAAERAGFEMFIICDQNIIFQQNVGIRRIAIVVLMTNRWNAIRAEPQTVQHAVDSAMRESVTSVRFSPQRGSRSPSNSKC